MLLSRPHLDSVANLLIHALEPLPLAAWGVALVLAALVRGRPRIALAVIAVIGLSQLTTEALKPLLAHPHLHVHGTHIGAASWPSGHSTAALAVAMSAVLVAPARRRPLVAAAGIAFALAVGCSLLILAWHLPSDVLGGYLVASLWTALTIAALRAAERRWPSAHRRVS
jgi:membrane-associated phospholipid phosphatase